MQTQEPVSISSLSCGLTLPNVNLQLDTFYEVPIFCPSQMSTSACATGSSNPYGIEAYVYSGIITLPQVCTDWIVSWDACCRTGNITTLYSTSTRIEAGINNTTCNNSPVFTSRAIGIFAAGKCYEYNHGGTDVENDPLIYAMSCPLEFANICATHAPGFSPSQPFATSPANSFAFDKNTGQMTFCTQDSIGQYAVVAVTIFQISNGDTIGYVQREASMIILNSLSSDSPIEISKPTVLQGGYYDSLYNNFSASPDSTLIFELIAYEPDGDSVALDSLNTNLDYVFGIGNWSIVTNSTAPYKHDSIHVLVQISNVPSSTSGIMN